MADDYGALAVMRLDGVRDGLETLSVKVVDVEFSAGRAFSLGGAQA
jgi:hypothetical protein